MTHYDTSRVQQKGGQVALIQEGQRGQGQSGESAKEAGETSEGKGQVKLSAKSIKRFWSKVDKRGDNECWEWKAGRDKDGYGQFSVGYVGTRAHRFSFLLHHGDIPRGMKVCHTCDNPPCANPKHLWLGTADDNNKDMKNKGRCATGAQNGAHTQPHRRATGDRHWSKLYPEKISKGSQQSQSRLSETIVKQIRDLVGRGCWTQAAAARNYGVSQTRISQIIKRKCWKHI